MKQKIGFWLYAVGAVGLLIAVAALVFFGGGFLIGWRLRLIMAMRWVMAVSAALNVAGRIMTLPATDDYRQKRLNNITALSSVMIIGAVYFLFTYKPAWTIALVLISALIDLWISFRSPKKS